MTPAGGPGPVLFCTTSAGYGLAQRVDTYEEALAFAERLVPAFAPGIVAGLEWQVGPDCTIRSEAPPRTPTKEKPAA